jgi:hypothetical protein
MTGYLHGLFSGSRGLQRADKFAAALVLLTLVPIGVVYAWRTTGYLRMVDSAVTVRPEVADLSECSQMAPKGLR